jgi:hypothetical protein
LRLSARARSCRCLVPCRSARPIGQAATGAKLPPAPSCHPVPGGRPGLPKRRRPPRVAPGGLRHAEKHAEIRLEQGLHVRGLAIEAMGNRDCPRFEPAGGPGSAITPSWERGDARHPCCFEQLSGRLPSQQAGQHGDPSTAKRSRAFIRSSEGSVGQVTNTILYPIQSTSNAVPRCGTRAVRVTPDPTVLSGRRALLSLARPDLPFRDDDSLAAPGPPSARGRRVRGARDGLDPAGAGDGLHRRRGLGRRLEGRRTGG